MIIVLSSIYSARQQLFDKLFFTPTWIIPPSFLSSHSSFSTLLLILKPAVSFKVFRRCRIHLNFEVMGKKKPHWSWELKWTTHKLTDLIGFIPLLTGSGTILMFNFGKINPDKSFADLLITFLASFSNNSWHFKEEHFAICMQQACCQGHVTPFKQCCQLCAGWLWLKL